MLVCPGWISQDSSPDSSKGRCSRWKPATSRACRIFPGFSCHLGTELFSEKYVFLTWLRLKFVSASCCLVSSWPSAEVDVLGDEGQILHPGLDQEEETREGKVCPDAKKRSEGASFPALLPHICSWSMEQWHWYVRTKAAVMETSARKSGVKTSRTKREKGINISDSLLAPDTRV